MTRVAIVLVAGGITGAAWLLGALEALHAHTGWDPRRADVVSGTSAGAIAAAALSGVVLGVDPMRAIVLRVWERWRSSAGPVVHAGGE